MGTESRPERQREKEERAGQHWRTKPTAGHQDKRGRKKIYRARAKEGTASWTERLSKEGWDREWDTERKIRKRERRTQEEKKGRDLHRDGERSSRERRRGKKREREQGREK